MQIIKETLEINEELNNKVINTLKFLNIKSKLEQGSIFHIPKTNIAYIDPHKLKYNGITYLFFNDCNDIFINDLTFKISFNELKDYLKNNKNCE